MDNQVNKITIDFGSNPELAAVFVDKKPGQKCKLTVEFSVDEIDNQQVVGSITEIESAKAKDDIKPNYKSPVMIMMSSKKEDDNDDGAYGSTPGL